VLVREYRLQAVEEGAPKPAAALPFGLTGGVASGKSTVAGYFQAMGAHIIDADRIGHQLIEPGREAYQEILNHFGRGTLDPSGRIDRRKLGNSVFADPHKLSALNAIVHPRIIARVDELAREYQAADPQAVVIVDAALIFEAGIGGRLRKVIVAWCRPGQQVERLIAKAGISRDEAERRIGAQFPVEEKRRRADYVIDCSGTLEETRQQTERVYRVLSAVAAHR
jgi:dephospho-CoA kinase